MELILMVLVTVLLGVVVGVVVWIAAVLVKSKTDAAVHKNTLDILQQQLEHLRQTQQATKDTITKSMQEGTDTLNKNLLASGQTLTKLHTQIGELLSSSKQMSKVGEEVRRLQDILTSPKLRGQMGEWSLKTMLEDMLPPDSFELQYGFKDGKKVDALVKVTDYSVPIDAKFPLPAFEKLQAARTEDEKRAQRKQFEKDVTVHIDKIASSYIRPSEGTLDFALMYIPAENVYYETLVRYDKNTKDILHYAHERKVIPVSPSLLNVYLMTVVMGLHGLQIEKQAAQIRRNLKSLNVDFVRFTSVWDTLGGHIRNAANKYDEGEKNLNRFGMRLERIQIEEDPLHTEDTEV